MSTTAAGATAERLGLEAERYLAVVEAFRGEGCQPSWRMEPVAQGRLTVLPRPTKGRDRC